MSELRKDQKKKGKFETVLNDVVSEQSLEKNYKVLGKVICDLQFLFGTKNLVKVLQLTSQFLLIFVSETLQGSANFCLPK